MNWVLPLRGILVELGHEYLLDRLSPEIWEAKRTKLIVMYFSNLSRAEITWYSNCSSCQSYILRQVWDAPAKYLKRCQYFALKVKAQLRLATIYAYNITFAGITYRLAPKTPCSVCHPAGEETVDHFLACCPCYQPLRQKYLAPLDSDLNSMRILSLGTAKST